jgi:hypothetical protein
VYLNGAMAISVIAHEIGHNLKPWHAGTLRCGSNVVYGGSCTRTDYGDPFDSFVGALRHAKARVTMEVGLGWFRAGDLAGKSKNPPAGGAGGAGERGGVALALQKQKEVAAQHRRQD